MYALNRNELRTFKAICDGAKSTADLAVVLKVSAISVYRAVESLSSKRMIETRRTGKRLLLSPSAHCHSKALAAYLGGSGRPIEPLIGSRLLVLLSVSSIPKSLDRVAEEVMLSSESVRRIVWALKGFGAIHQDKSTLMIPQQDTAMVRFSQDFSKGASMAKLESIAPAGTILWNEGLEFMFTSRTPVSSRGVSETGITAMSKRGLQFMSTAMYYHFAYWRPRLKKEDIAMHQILIDPNSTRNISYGLLFLMREGYNPTYLAKTGYAIGAGVLARQIAVYLKGEVVENPHFPSQSGMEQLRAQYGVK
jgi:predicted transcriptional regulator